MRRFQQQSRTAYATKVARRHAGMCVDHRPSDWCNCVSSMGVTLRVTPRRRIVVAIRCAIAKSCAARIGRAQPDAICGTQALDTTPEEFRTLRSRINGLRKAPVAFARVWPDAAYRHRRARDRGCSIALAAPMQACVVIGKWCVCARNWPPNRRTCATRKISSNSSSPQIPIPCGFIDCATLRFVSVNDAAVRTYGFSREEFLGMTLLDIRPPEEKPTFLDSVNQIHPGL